MVTRGERRPHGADFDLSQVRAASPMPATCVRDAAGHRRRRAWITAVVDYAVRIAARHAQVAGHRARRRPARQHRAGARRARAGGARRAATSSRPTTCARSPSPRCAIASRWRRNCRSKARAPTTFCTRCWPRWTRRASEARTVPAVAADGVGRVGRRDEPGAVAGVGMWAAGAALLLLALSMRWRAASSPDADRRAPRCPTSCRWASSATCSCACSGGVARRPAGCTRPASGRLGVQRPAAHAAAGAGQRVRARLSAAADRARRRSRFDGVQLRLHSPLRLWRQSRVAEASQRGARLSEFRAAGATGAAQRRAGLARGRRAPQAPPRRGHRLPPDARLPRRRQHAPDRLEGDRAHAPADLARVPGRAQPAADAGDRHRPPHAGARTAGWRTSTRCSTPCWWWRTWRCARAMRSACSPAAAIRAASPPQRGMGGIDVLLRACYDLVPRAGGDRLPRRRDASCRCGNAGADW